MPDISKIRFDRERQFAAAFFDHDQWEHESHRFALSDGTTYLPDFYDGKRDTHIEVVGTRQAFHYNKAKYEIFKAEYPHVNFEFRDFDGRLLQPQNGNLTRKVSPDEIDVEQLQHESVKMFEKYRDEYADVSGVDMLRLHVERTGLSSKVLQKMTGLSQPLISMNISPGKNKRGIGVQAAMAYHKGLGLPLENLLKQSTTKQPEGQP